MYTDICEPYYCLGGAQDGTMSTTRKFKAKKVPRGYTMALKTLEDSIRNNCLQPDENKRSAKTNPGWPLVRCPMNCQFQMSTQTW